MVTLANGFAARGHTVDLVLASAEGPYLKDVSPAVRLVDLRARRVSSSLPRLVCYLKREKPAALLSAMGHANVVAVAARVLARAPTRVVVSERNNFSASGGYSRSSRRRLTARLMRHLYRRADGVIAISVGVADDLATSIGLPRDCIDVVYNPALTEAVIRLSGEPCHHPWLQPGQPPVILAVGRLVPQKDFSTLIQAFARLRERHEARLLILGEGDLRRALEAKVSALDLNDAVALPGFTDNPFSHMRRASMFVLSSGWEGFGNVLVEAMACGTPVVSTDCPSGPAEILEHGKWGRLVPMGDVEALADAMVATLGETKHPDVASRAAQFNVDHAVLGYLEVMLRGSKG